MKKFIIETCCFCLIIMLVLFGLYRLPRNPNNYMCEYDIKMLKISSPNRKPSIILLGGSATAFGYDSKMIEDSIGIPVINAGLHAGLTQYIILDDCLPKLIEGDILVYSPEYYTLSDGANGGSAVNYLLMYSNVDTSHLRMSHWKNVIENIPAVLKGNILYTLSNKQNPNIGTDELRSFNLYGDIKQELKKDNIRYDGGKASNLSHIDINLVSHIIENFNNLANKCKVIVFPAPIAESSYNVQKNFIKSVYGLFKEGKFPFAVNAKEEVYSDTLFYDTENHLGRKGAEMRSQHLIKLLKKK